MNEKIIEVEDQTRDDARKDANARSSLVWDRMWTDAKSLRQWAGSSGIPRPVAAVAIAQGYGGMFARALADLDDMLDRRDGADLDRVVGAVMAAGFAGSHPDIRAAIAGWFARHAPTAPVPTAEPAGSGAEPGE